MSYVDLLVQNKLVPDSYSQFREQYIEVVEQYFEHEREEATKHNEAWTPVYTPCDRIQQVDDEIQRIVINMQEYTRCLIKKIDEVLGLPTDSPQDDLMVHLPQLEQPSLVPYNAKRNESLNKSVSYQALDSEDLVSTSKRLEKVTFKEKLSDDSPNRRKTSLDNTEPRNMNMPQPARQRPVY